MYGARYEPIALSRVLSGLEYKRSRDYDPQTGQFTQEYLIGAAEGLNLCGFASGDPE